MNRPLTLDDYQELAGRTSLWKDTPAWNQQAVTATALALAGEVGEMANKIKKLYFHGEPVDHDEIRDELGDVQWYVADLARLLGCALGQLAEQNIEKLRRRWPDGFRKGERPDG